MDDVIRQRLRVAIKRTGRKHSDIAWRAGVSPLTLSRILNEPACNPYFATILRLARAIDEPLGALVNEPAPLSAADVQELQTASGILQRLLLRATGEQ